jgi:hypothetical protein
MKMNGFSQRASAVRRGVVRAAGPTTPATFISRGPSPADRPVTELASPRMCAFDDGDCVDGPFGMNAACEDRQGLAASGWG